MFVTVDVVCNLLLTLCVEVVENILEKLRLQNEVLRNTLVIITDMQVLHACDRVSGLTVDEKDRISIVQVAGHWFVMCRLQCSTLQCTKSFQTREVYMFYDKRVVCVNFLVLTFGLE